LLHFELPPASAGGSGASQNAALAKISEKPFPICFSPTLAKAKKKISNLDFADNLHLKVEAI
jgi:hypothetical protein